MGRFGAFLICVPLMAMSVGSGAFAQDYYSGKTITLISGESGGYDSYARLLASYMGRYIPGRPNIVVKNMLGAATMVAANYIYNVAAPDGLTFGGIERAIPLAPLLGDPAAHYDATKFTWIGTSSSYRDDAFLLIVNKKLGLNSIADLRAMSKPLTIGSTGPTSAGDVGTRVISSVLGLNMKLVRGYPGTPNVALAVEQGEMDGMMLGLSSLTTTKPEWLKPDSPVQFLLQFGYGGDGRNPRFPNVPRIEELAQTDDQKAIFSLMQLPFSIARPFAAPPNLSPDKAKILVDAFMATNRDPEYLATAAKMGLDISPISGEAIPKLIKQAEALSPALIKRYTDILAQTGD